MDPRSTQLHQNQTFVEPLFHAHFISVSIFYEKISNTSAKLTMYYEGVQYISDVDKLDKCSDIVDCSMKEERRSICLVPQSS